MVENVCLCRLVVSANGKVGTSCRFSRSPIGDDDEPHDRGPIAADWLKRVNRRCKGES